MEDGSQFYHIGHPLLQSRQCHLAFRPQPEVRAGATARPASAARPGHAEHRCTALTPLSLSARDRRPRHCAGQQDTRTTAARRKAEKPTAKAKRSCQKTLFAFFNTFFTLAWICAQHEVDKLCMFSVYFEKKLFIQNVDRATQKWQHHVPACVRTEFVTTSRRQRPLLSYPYCR